MQDLFGTELDVNENQVLSEDEIDNLVENIFFEGELIAQVGANLEKLKNQKSTKINPVRKMAWEDFLWIYDLGMPAALSFDRACEASNADAENIRCMVSKKFGDEIRTMCQVITTRMPECAEEISRKLSRYVKLN